MSELPLTPGTLPAPFTCYQSLYNEMFALGAAQGPAITGLLIQDATPDAGDHDKGWIPTAGGVPRFPGYVFVWNTVYGHWVSRHYIADSDPSLRIYTGALDGSGDVPAAYDGGDTGALGPASGRMWTIEPAMAGSVPVGVGTIPNSGGATIAMGATMDSLGQSGEYSHVLTAGEMNGHFHGVATDGAPGGGDPPIMISRAWNSGASTPNTYTERLENTGGSGTWVDGASFAAGTMSTTNPFQDSVNVSGAHNNMMPYKGVAFIKRTIRQFYVAA